MKKKSIIISLAVLICIGGIYTIYTMNNSSKNTSSKVIQSNIKTNNIKTEKSIENLHTTDNTNRVQQTTNDQQSNSEKQTTNDQQSNSEKQVTNDQQSNSEKQVTNDQQQSNSNLNNILGIYYSSKIIGENKFYGDNTLVLTNNLYAFNGTNISNPIYYTREVSINNLTTSSIVGEKFGQNTQFKIIIPVPSNASSKTIDNYISFALSQPSNFPCIGNNELIVFNSYKGAVVLKK